MPVLAQVYLESDGKEADARVVAARLERTKLGQIAKRIKITNKPMIGKMGAFVQARDWGIRSMQGSLRCVYIACTWYGLLG